MANKGFTLDKVEKLVAIIAHSDDEAFGPAGTLAMLTDKGKEIHIICVTDNDDKTIVDKPKNLAEIRKKELKKSAKVLGVKKVHFLGYKDGELSNNAYHRIAEDIKEILDKVNPDTLLTFEHRGISGHIDHIVCSMVTSYLFEKLAYVKNILYHAILKEYTDNMVDYFIYFPDGYEREDIDLVVDTKDYWDKKVEAIKAHESQVGNAKEVLSMFEDREKADHFLVKSKG